MKKYIIALDQGTSSSRTVLYDASLNVIDSNQKEFRQIFPKPGWVEHDAEEIWECQMATFKELLDRNDVSASEIASIGITNQRETTVLWDKATGKTVYNAIVWQDRRTADYCRKLKERGWEEKIRSSTGLVIDSYFSATKIKWVLDEHSDLRSRAKAGEILFGTIDSWLLWKLTAGEVHATDASNASRTMLYNIHSGAWDEEILELMDIPKEILPEVMDSSGRFGTSKIAGEEILIGGIAGDQQAALIGQACFKKGMIKNTYGTGCFTLMNTGEEVINSTSGLLSTIAFQLDGKVTYALEGSVFVAGAAIQWLRDGLGFLESSSESEEIAMQVEDSGGVVVVPAFTGLGAPYWDMYARGAIFGLTRGTGKEHLVRATLESLAFQCVDLIGAMEKDAGSISSVRVDGGACANNLLMQFQADVLQHPIERAKDIESTALGAAVLAGMAAGLFDKSKIEQQWGLDRRFEPRMDSGEVTERLKKWNSAVERTMNWEDPED